jgi:starvation-inducible outer membrane lipoprotein
VAATPIRASKAMVMMKLVVLLLLQQLPVDGCSASPDMMGSDDGGMSECCMYVELDSMMIHSSERNGGVVASSLT